MNTESSKSVIVNIIFVLGSVASIASGMYILWDRLEKTIALAFFLILMGVIVITSIVIGAIRRYWPQRLQRLHVSTHSGTIETEKGDIIDALVISISNLYSTRLYISRAIFRPCYRRFLFWKQKTKLNIHPGAPRIAHLRAYELKLGEKELSGERVVGDYDTLIKPNGKAYSCLPLSERAKQEFIDSRQCGMIVLEYSLAGKSGRHIDLV